MMPGNDKGNTLIQVIVSIGLIGILSLAFASMMSQMSSAQKVAQIRQEIIGITQEVQTMFSSQAICSASLPVGMSFNLSQADDVYPPAAGAGVTGMPFQFRINGDLLVSNGVLENYSVNLGQVLMVNAGSVGVNVSGHPIYRGDIVAEFIPKSGSSAFGMKTLVSGFFTTDGGNLSSCSLLAPNSLTQIMLSCQEIGGIFRNGSCLTKADGEDPDLLASLCPLFNGSLSDGFCTIPSSGGSSGAGGSRWVLTTGSQCYIRADICNSQDGVQLGHTCSTQGRRCCVTGGYLSLGTAWTRWYLCQ